MSNSEYMAWNGELYDWPPPSGWYKASDDRWWAPDSGPDADPGFDPSLYYDNLGETDKASATSKGGADAPIVPARTTADDDLTVGIKRPGRGTGKDATTSSDWSSGLLPKPDPQQAGQRCRLTDLAKAKGPMLGAKPAPTNGRVPAAKLNGFGDPPKLAGGPPQKPATAPAAKTPAAKVPTATAPAATVPASKVPTKDAAASGNGQIVASQVEPVEKSLPWPRPVDAPGSAKERVLESLGRPRVIASIAGVIAAASVLTMFWVVGDDESTEQAGSVAEASESAASSSSQDGDERPATTMIDEVTPVLNEAPTVRPDPDLVEDYRAGLAKRSITTDSLQDVEIAVFADSSCVYAGASADRSGYESTRGKIVRAIDNPELTTAELEFTVDLSVRVFCPDHADRLGLP